MRRTMIAAVCGVAFATMCLVPNPLTMFAQSAAGAAASMPAASATGPASRIASGRDWPQLQGNPQRTGYTPDTVKPPFRVAWKREFLPERVHCFVQAVTFGGKVFVGTTAGNLYALGAADGKEAWKFACGSAILHTAACADGKVVVSALDGVYAVDVESGKLAWKFAGNPRYDFSAAPLIAEDTVFIGQRGGTFYALSLADGKPRWEFKPGEPILNSAAYDDGKVFFCDEKIIMHCLDAKTGKEVWKSEQLYGQSAKGYCPVIVNGYVIFRPMAALTTRPPYASEDEAKRLPQVKTDPQQDGLPPELMAFQDKIVQRYKERPYLQDLFILDEATGKQAFIAPHFCSLLAIAGGCGAPAWDGKQSIFLPWSFGAFATYWGRFDLKSQRFVEVIDPKTVYGNPDETVNVTVGGNRLFILHCMHGFEGCQYTGTYDLDKKQCAAIPETPNLRMLRVTFCGNNAASIANGYFYHIALDRLQAWTSAEGEAK